MKKRVEDKKLAKVAGGHEEEQQPLVKSSRHKVCANCCTMYPENENTCPNCGSSSIKKII